MRKDLFRPKSINQSINQSIMTVWLKVAVYPSARGKKSQSRCPMSLPKIELRILSEHSFSYDKSPEMEKWNGRKMEQINPAEHIPHQVERRRNLQIKTGSACRDYSFLQLILSGMFFEVFEFILGVRLDGVLSRSPAGCSGRKKYISHA